MERQKRDQEQAGASGTPVRAIVRALDIIEALGQAENGTGLADLAALLHLPHPTTYRILKTLELKGFVRQDPASSLYYLSTKILQMQATMATRRSLVKPAIPVLTRLSAQFACTAHLAVLGEDRVVYVESRRSDPYTLQYLPPGRTNPVHSTALGKVLAAFLPEEQLQTLISRIAFEARTPRTITDPHSYIACLEQVRDRGYAVDDEENENGVGCVAAPVRDHRGNVVAAISVSMSVTQLRSQNIADIAVVVKRGAEEISRELGWRRC